MVPDLLQHCAQCETFSNLNFIQETVLLKSSNFYTMHFKLPNKPTLIFFRFYSCLTTRDGGAWEGEKV
jgi:hypothetical protein